MTIKIPELKPETIKQVESDFGTSISSYIWKKVIEHQMWTNRSLPIGSILSFFGSQLLARTGPSDELVPQPSSTFWQWCDGSIINNSNSPLLGENTPNFKEKFLKGSSIIGLLGGQSTINLQHNHSGYTSFQSDRSNQIVCDAAADRPHGSEHRHSISNNWSSAESVIPPYMEVQYYLRIDGGAENSFAWPDNIYSTSFGNLINEDMVKYAKILSEELATNLYINALLLDNIVPIASIIPIMTNISGVEPPDPNIFQECDGSEITNENSPLRSIGGEIRRVPDFTDRYVRVPSAFGLSGEIGGINDTNYFHHNHGGLTGVHVNAEDGDPSIWSYMAEPVHRHEIYESLPNSINLEPPFYTVKFYMRIQ